MATGNAINANGTGIAKYDGMGSWSTATTTNHSVLVGAASNGITSIALTNGQLAIGSTGADPVAATLTAGSNIVVTNGAGTIAISSYPGGLPWVDVIATPQVLAVNTAYLADSASPIVFSLPATAAQFSVIEIKGYGAGGWSVTQNAGQQIRFGSSATVATSGGLASTNANDGIRMVATVAGASTIWTITDAIGNITIT